MGSIPGQGAHTWAAGLTPGRGAYRRQPIDVTHIDVSLSLSPSLSKINNQYPQVRIKKKIWMECLWKRYTQVQNTFQNMKDMCVFGEWVVNSAGSSLYGENYIWLEGLNLPVDVTLFLTWKLYSQLRGHVVSLLGGLGREHQFPIDKDIDHS